MDKDRYSGNCLFKVEAGNGEEEQKKILCLGGLHTAPSMRYFESYMIQQIEVSDIGIRDTPPPPPPSKKVLKAYLKKS